MQTPIKWSEVMRVKRSADDERKYVSLLATFTLFGVIWFGGALRITERVRS